MARCVLTRSRMTQPRCIRPGRTWLVTRRTSQRRYLLRPDADGTSQSLYWYTTAVYAQKFGIKVHAVQVLSTHLHEVLTDLRGKLPAFLRERNRALANALKAHRRWPEEVFQRAPASCVELYGPEAIVNAIAYTLANCVEAGLAASPAAWPGVTTNVEDVGRRVVRVLRPKMYFDSKNPVWPAEVSLPIDTPPLLEQTFGNTKAALAKLRSAVRGAIACATATLKKAGRSFARVADLTLGPFTRTASAPQKPSDRNPTFATGGNATQLRLAVAERRAFLAMYRIALHSLRRGLLGIPFPEGTWRWAHELIPPLPLAPLACAA